MSSNQSQLVHIVTGAASGMGAAAAKLQHAAGLPLLLCDLSEDRLAAAKDELGGGAPVETFAGDLASDDFSDRLIAALAERQIGSLIHCAGISPTMADPQRILEVNLDATIRLLDAVRPHMAAGSAAVVFASTAGHMIGTQLDEPISAALEAGSSASLLPLAAESGAAYSISKRGVHLLVRREAAAFGRQSARIVSVSPGIIDTPMGRAEMALQPQMAHLVASSALPRSAEASEVAAVAVFLASPAASFVMGTDVLVDGGSMAGLGIR